MTDPRLQVQAANITALVVDAIVNAANPTLLGGGGVDGAIHAAAGPSLLSACRQLPEVSPNVRCRAGEVRVTAGYELPARYVIHTVGPVWQGGHQSEVQVLAACYRNALKLGTELGVRSIAFPAISCGVYGFPLALAAETAVGEVQRFLETDRALNAVILVAFSSPVQAALENAVHHASC